MKLSHAVVQATIALLERPDDRHWGYVLSQRTGITNPVLYVMLRRMVADNLLTDGWEDPSLAVGRPLRRYYQLTPDGRDVLSGVIERARSDPRFRSLFTDGKGAGNAVL